MGNKRSIHRRMVKYNVLLSAIIVFSLFMIFIAFFADMERDRTEESVQSSAEITSIQLVSMMNQLDNTCLQLSVNNYIWETFSTAYQDVSQENYFNTHLADASFIRTFMWSYDMGQTISSRVCIYNKYGDFVRTGDLVDSENIDSYIAQYRLNLLDQLLEQEDDYVYQIYTTDPLDPDREAYIAVIRDVSDLMRYGNEPIAYVETQLSLSSIAAGLSLIASDDTSVMLVSQHDDFYLDASGNQQTYDYFVSQYGDFLEMDFGSNQYGNGVVSVTQVDETNLVLYVYNTGKTLTHSIEMAVALSVALFLVVLILFMVVQNRLVGNIIRPLIELFDKVERSDFLSQNVSIDTAPQVDELSALNQSFDSMLQTMRQSAQHLVLAQTGQLRAQLLALQAQTDPHYIHNTLSVIVALAQEQECQKVEDVASRLSEMIRYSADFDQSTVGINEEVNQLRHYLELLQARYETNFYYQIYGNACDEKFSIPKFITQPLAENAMNHSLKLAQFPWIIDVGVFCDDEDWWIEFADNGAGISQERADALNQEIDQHIHGDIEKLMNKIKIGGFSLFNIAARMQIIYQDDMRISIRPRPEGGTIVTLGGKR